MDTKEQAVRETIEAALVEILKTGNSAPKLYLRVQPDGTVQTDEQASWCCSPDEYYKRVPHTLSLEVLKFTRDYSDLSAGEIEECADCADDAAAEIMRGWEYEIAEWITAGNLVGSEVEA